MKILGISAFFHDSAACLLGDGGVILSAAQEERFTRIKHDSRFPIHSIKFCLEANNLSIEELDFIVFYEKPLKKFQRLVHSFLSESPFGFEYFNAALQSWVNGKILQGDMITEQICKEFGYFDRTKLLFSEHHLSHAASAFYPSPFEEAAILTIDGVGEDSTTSLAIGRGNQIEIIEQINYPHSLGLFYATLTSYLGFKVNSGEYKVMGLAPYGEPRFTKLFKDNLINLHGDGSFNLNMAYFDFTRKIQMFGPSLETLLGQPRRSEETVLTQFHMDVAASLQKVTEEAVLNLSLAAKKRTGMNQLCLAGGVALNCVANGKLLQKKIFDDLWIQPASGDAGGALGAALVIYFAKQNNQRNVVLKKDSMCGSYLGTEYSNSVIKRELSSSGAMFRQLAGNDIISETAKLLSEGKAVGWFQGKMEFGPRALGGRSILSDPRASDTQRKLNLKIKFRESFRPFAPSILEKYVSDWFDLEEKSPYMLLVADVQEKRKKKTNEEEKKLFGIEKLNVPRSEIPAVTHVDYSSRVQTVGKDTNQRYHDLISHFYELTGCPVLVNTSFNIRGEPIVESVKDAFRCFMGTELDALAIGDFLLLKKDQNTKLCEDYRNEFELD